MIQYGPEWLVLPFWVGVRDQKYSLKYRSRVVRPFVSTPSMVLINSLSGLFSLLLL